MLNAAPTPPLDLESRMKQAGKKSSTALMPRKRPVQGRSRLTIERILEGEPGPKRDVVLLNAAAALVIAGRASDFAVGVRCAADAVDSGAGLRLLAQLRKFG